MHPERRFFRKFANSGSSRVQGSRPRPLRRVSVTVKSVGPLDALRPARPTGIENNRHRGNAVSVTGPAGVEAAPNGLRRVPPPSRPGSTMSVHGDTSLGVLERRPAYRDGYRRRCARGCRTRAACAANPARCAGRAVPRSRCGNWQLWVRAAACAHSTSTARSVLVPRRPRQRSNSLTRRVTFKGAARYAESSTPGVVPSSSGSNGPCSVASAR